MKKLIIIAAVLGLSATASANFVIAPGLGYYTQSDEATQPALLTTDTETTELRADVKVGYILPMGLYLGGMYAHIGQEVCSGGTCADSSGFLVGPSIGYHSLTGFYILGTYHIMGEQGDTLKLTGGKGPQVDLGWVFPISTYVGIGPQITWRSIEYDKVESAGLSQDTDYKNSSIAPYVSLWFMF